VRECVRRHHELVGAGARDELGQSLDDRVRITDDVRPGCLRDHRLLGGRVRAPGGLFRARQRAGTPGAQAQHGQPRRSVQPVRRRGVARAERLHADEAVWLRERRGRPEDPAVQGKGRPGVGGIDVIREGKRQAEQAG